MSALPEHSDNVEEEMRRVRLAMEAVFAPQAVSNDPSNWWEQRQLADRYLTSFQGSSIAWMVCDRLLQDNSPAADPQAVIQQQQQRFFAAQTIHTKCRTDVFQLPPSSLPSLRDSLFVHLGTYSTMGDAALTNRLAMAVSALAVQMAWTTIVTDLLSTVSSDPKKRTIVMQIFKVLAEECASDRLVLVDENERYYMRDHLVAMSSDVFRFIQSWDGAANTAYEVLHTWIRHVPVRPNVITGSPLLEATFHALMIPLSSKLPFDQALASGDEDILRTYCRIITEMAESYMSLILSNQLREASQLVEWVLRCSSIQETEISSMTLHFWYRMVMDLESIQPYEFRQDLIDRYTPYLLQLIDVCSINLMKYPSDISDLSDDEKDEINRNRFYVSETVEDCCRLIGGQVVLERLGRHLQNQVQRASTDMLNSWPDIESCLMCILSINKFIPSDESTFLPFCFELIPRLPSDIELLRCTASKLIGKYALWLIGHPHLLQPLMPFLAQGLSIPSCSPAAALSIKELCKCSNQNMAIGEPVLQLYTEITASPGILALNAELEVLEGACRAISRQVHDTKVDGSTYVQRIVQPIGSRLAAKAADQSSKPKQDIIPELDRLTVIVQCLNIPRLPTSSASPVVEIIHSVWPILDTLSVRFALNNAMAEKICRLHKHALRSCGAAAYEPMLEPLMKQLIQSYVTSRQSAYLYAASICVTEYGRDPKHASNLFNMISTMASVSFAFLKNLEDLTQHPDVVEELFYMMGRMITHCPEPLVMSPLLRSLFQCAAVGMQLDHSAANKGTLNFVENSISYGLSVKEQNNREPLQALESVLAVEGQSIVNNLARSLVGDLPAYSVDVGSGSIAGVLWKLHFLSPAAMSQWITVALTNAPERPRAEFLGILNSGVPRNDFNTAVRGFMSACKRERRLAGR
eukprot:jgi/Psemu1/250852/estExt_Genewise1Plus.C_210167